MIATTATIHVNYGDDQRKIEAGISWDECLSVSVIEADTRITLYGTPDTVLDTLARMRAEALDAIHDHARQQADEFYADMLRERMEEEADERRTFAGDPAF